MAFRRFVPSGYSSSQAAPLFVVAHGFGSSPLTSARHTKMEIAAEVQGALTVFPNGLKVGPARGWSFPGCNSVPLVGETDCKGRRATCSSFSSTCATNCPSPYATNVSGCDDGASMGCSNWAGNGNCNWCGCSDDESFIRSLVADVKNKLCVDEAQVVMAGMSQGGMFTSWVSTRMGDLFSGFAPVSGTNPRDFYEEVDGDADFSMLWIHGTEDTVVASDGTAGRWSDTFVYERPMDDAARVAAKFGCDEVVSVALDVAALAGDIKSSHELVCSEHQHCNLTAAGNARRVVYCMWKGDHDWAQSTVGQHKAWGSTMMMKYMLARSKVLPSHVANNHTADCTVVKSKKKGAMAFGIVMLIAGVGVVGYFAKTKLYDPPHGAGGARYSVVTNSEGGGGGNND